MHIHRRGGGQAGHPARAPRCLEDHERKALQRNCQAVQALEYRLPRMKVCDKALISLTCLVPAPIFGDWPFEPETLAMLCSIPWTIKSIRSEARLRLLNHQIWQGQVE